MRNILIAFAALVTISTSASAGTTVINGDRGGAIGTYVTKALAYEKDGTRVKFTGSCASSCTLFISHEFKLNRCMTPNARFGFHKPYDKAARTKAHFDEVAHLTKLTWAAYPSKVKAYLTKNGWPSVMDGDPTNKLTWMSAKQMEGIIPYCKD